MFLITQHDDKRKSTHSVIKMKTVESHAISQLPHFISFRLFPNAWTRKEIPEGCWGLIIFDNSNWFMEAYYKNTASKEYKWRNGKGELLKIISWISAVA